LSQYHSGVGFTDPTGALTGDYTIRMSYSGTGVSKVLEYIGKAAPGSSESSAVWQIQKMVYDASNDMTERNWADGNVKFDNVWTNRAALSYS
jgi:YD repeat-containing protein